jgi:hypothetical protein
VVLEVCENIVLFAGGLGGGMEKLVAALCFPLFDTLFLSNS